MAMARQRRGIPGALELVADVFGEPAGDKGHHPGQVRTARRPNALLGRGRLPYLKYSGVYRLRGEDALTGPSAAGPGGPPRRPDPG